ncbi:MAG: DUF4405 domain-containing protein [Clostridia bacterium]|nr:DUF4405 domain-containing protein [Clostridia bacterium]
MKVKRKLQIAADVLMSCILLLQMSYSIAGEVLHEILGIALFVLFVLHHILSVNFTKALFKGKPTAEKTLKVVIDILLTVDVLALMVSALFISNHVFTFLGLHHLAAFGRTLHLLASYWGFALMSLHIGFHLDFMLHKVMKEKRKKTAAIAIMIVVSAAGLACFIHEETYKYMLLINQFVFFDVAGGLPLFLLKYILMAAMFATIGYAMIRLVKRRTK